MPTVTFIEASGEQHVVEAATGESLMMAARQNGVPGIDADCGGVCACATCHVYVDEAWVSLVGPPSEDEKEMLDCATAPAENSRLSCQVELSDALDKLVVRLPATQR